jgi:nitric oxide reductase large subunit
MRLKKIQHVKLWVVMVTAAVFWTIGAGFFGDLDAKSDESYEGLKIFAGHNTNLFQATASGPGVFRGGGPQNKVWGR